MRRKVAVNLRILVASVEVSDVPFVRDINRIEITKMKGGFFQLTVHYGFMEQPDIPQTLSLYGSQGLPMHMKEASFLLGRATLIPKIGSGMKLWREKLFIYLFRNASSVTAFLKIPSNRVVELGAQVVL